MRLSDELAGTTESRKNSEAERDSAVPMVIEDENVLPATPFRTYGTLQHLVLKTLNALLGDVQFSKGSSDAVHVGYLTRTLVTALYVERSMFERHRTVAVLFDVVKRGNSVVVARFSWNETENCLTGCSCRDETLLDTCDHTEFLMCDVRIRDVIMDILRIRSEGVGGEDSEVVKIPSNGKGNYQYWLWFNRRFHSKFLSSVVILKERISRPDLAKEVPLSLRIDCFKC